MKLTPKMLVELRACYRDGEGVLESEPASLSALLDFAEAMLPLRDALLTLLAAEEKLAAERAKHVPRAGGPPGQLDAIHASAEAGFTAYKAFWQLARELAEKEAKGKP